MILPQGGDNMIKTITPVLHYEKIHSIPQIIYFGEITITRKTFFKYYNKNKKYITVKILKKDKSYAIVKFNWFFPSSQFNVETDLTNYKKFNILFQQRTQWEPAINSAYVIGLDEK